MLKKLLIFGPIIVLSLALVAGLAFAAVTAVTVPNGDKLVVTCANGRELSTTRQSQSQITAACAALPAVTATPVAGTISWHPNGGHVGAVNQHEHGDQNPSWTNGQLCVPFSQTRESHVGYKGTLATDQSNAVESYIIPHVLSTNAAASHGDHDAMMFVREPNGAVSCWDSIMDFGSPPVLRLSDTGERPIIFSNGDGGCETWYSRPGFNVFDIGYTICNRYQKFDGTVLGGNGAFRTVDWVVLPDRFPGAGMKQLSPTLAARCTVQFGVCRFTFLKSSADYSPAQPIN